MIALAYDPAHGDFASWIRANDDGTIAAAEARAAAAVASGVEVLKIEYARAPEHKRQDRPDGRTYYWTSPRAELRGHLIRMGVDPETIER